MNNTLKVVILMMQIIYVVDDLIVLNTMGNVIPCLPFIPQFIFFVPHGDGHSQSEYYDTNIIIMTAMMMVALVTEQRHADRTSTKGKLL